MTKQTDLDQSDQAAVDIPDSIVAWGTVALETGRDLISLFQAELKLSLSRVPVVIVLAIILIQFLVLLWLGVSVLISWAMAVALGTGTGMGLATFIMLQLLGAVLIGRKIMATVKAMSFPATRDNLKRVMSAAREFPVYEKPQQP